MKRTRYLVTFLLLVAYTGQSLVAVAVPCLMSEPRSGDIVAALPDAQHELMAHAGHHMDSSEQLGASGSNSCCDGGLCSMSHCHAVAALPPTLPGDELIPAVTYPNLVPLTSPTRTTASLYRPPISR